MQPIKLIASAVISELQSSDMYLSIRGRLCDVSANLNQVKVTEAFIDEIVANKEKYTCIPLCADVRGLVNDKTIGHMYNKSTGEFMSQIIGAMYDFEKEGSGDSTSLIISVRVMKRYSAVCAALTKLFAENRLKFSFEISCGEYSKAPDGTMIIDASPSNYLEGAAVVTFPACEDAVALELVAECLNKGDENMNADEEKIVETADETAEVIVEHTVETIETVTTYDTDTGVSSFEQTRKVENVTVPCEFAEEAAADVHEEVEASDEVTQASEETAEQSEEVSDAVEETAEETASAEEAPAEETAAAEETTEDEVACNNCDDKDKDEDERASEESVEAEADANNTIAELLSAVKALAEELASLKESISHREEAVSENNVDEEVEEVTASVEPRWTLVNPFTDSMAMPVKKFSLLEKK